MSPLHLSFPFGVDTFVLTHTAIPSLRPANDMPGSLTFIEVTTDRLQTEVIGVVNDAQDPTLLFGHALINSSETAQTAGELLEDGYRIDGKVRAWREVRKMKDRRRVKNGIFRVGRMVKNYVAL